MIEAASRLLATYVANALWQIPIVLVIATFSVWRLSRTRWAHRHMLWVGALVLSAFLPLWGLRSPVSRRDAVPYTQTRDAIGTNPDAAIGDGYADRGNLFYNKGRNERVIPCRSEPRSTIDIAI